MPLSSAGSHRGETHHRRDLVEYELTGVTQISVDDRRGLTFARALRTMVRLDPTSHGRRNPRRGIGDIAVRAAMTGHLVFSTLHPTTRSAQFHDCST